MSLDLTKLLPAVWMVAGKDTERKSIIGPTHYEDGRPIDIPELDAWNATMEFAALARNAFDVMMRRGWGVESSTTSERLPVVWSFQAVKQDGNLVHEVIYDDPFTALVEADRWYREHVEAPHA